MMLAIFVAVATEVGVVAPTAVRSRFHPLKNSISSLNFKLTRCRMLTVRLRSCFSDREQIFQNRQMQVSYRRFQFEFVMLASTQSAEGKKIASPSTSARG
ncbi:hypothetical protein FHT76_006586 [Rhizobium sp. BK176]|nr:hypothetical protein [Rhizobium sp. BK181]MBB3543079.1 hypothetical protein [Rhizobium sp. BK399]MCS3742294.1 hypothetical protein [Rhizobium sp. BK661]MCS4094877.1 hypothetical protein [Rhizobium sp. BK176]